MRTVLGVLGQPLELKTWGTRFMVDQEFSKKESYLFCRYSVADNWSGLSSRQLGCHTGF